MKATLIVKNIFRLYTGNPAMPVVENGCLASFHEKIIFAGSMESPVCLELLDPDLTCVIDAQGEIVVPAFIEPCTCMNLEPGFQAVRRYHEILAAMRQNGILNGVCCHKKGARFGLEQDIYYRKPDSGWRLVTFYNASSPLEPHDLLSCGLAEGNGAICSLLPVMSLLYLRYHQNPLQILESATSRTAAACRLAGKGILCEGNDADFLVLKAVSLEDYFSCMGMNLIHRQVKAGIQIYPAIVRC